MSNEDRQGFLASQEQIGFLGDSVAAAKRSVDLHLNTRRLEVVTNYW
jgi:hypothetical protein